VSAFQQDALSLDPPALAEAVQEGGLDARGQPLAEREHTYPVHLPRLLRLGSAGRDQQAKAEEEEQNHPVLHGRLRWTARA
jgi:hypothetical protein